MKPFEIFRSGTHIDSSGQELTFTDADLMKIAAAYNPEVHEAPMVIGHPKSDDPAMGWVHRLEFRNGLLFAIPHQVNWDFEHEVRGGTWKKRSAAFYGAEDPSNPVPGGWYLRHVGFLGAQPPAVKGLRPVAFGEGEEFTAFESSLEVSVEGEDKTKSVEFAEREKKLKASEEAATKREAALLLREKEIVDASALNERASMVAFVEKCGKEGRVLPTEEKTLVETLLTLPSTAEKGATFAEGETVPKPPRQRLQEFLEGLPPRVDFKERAASGAPLPDANDPVKVAAAARQYVAEQQKVGRRVSFSEACKHVSDGVK